MIITRGFGILGGGKFVGMGYDSPSAPWNYEPTPEEIEAYEEEEAKEKWLEENGYEWPDNYGEEYKCPNCNNKVELWTEQCKCGQNIRWE